MRAVAFCSDDMLTYPYDNYTTRNMTIPVTIKKFSEEILVGIPHTKSATKWAEKWMPKQDKEVGHKCHNFAPQQAGNPLLCLIGNFMVRIGGKYVEAIDLCAEKC